MTTKETFTREVTFLHQEPDLVNRGPEGEIIMLKNPVTKTVTFYDLDQTDRDQHKFHFDITAFFTSSSAKSVDEDEEATVTRMNTGAIYDLSVKFIKKFTMVTAEFTAKDKEELLNDSKAIFAFSMWFISGKVVPFFRKLMED